MNLRLLEAFLLLGALLVGGANAGQSPAKESDEDVPISHRDRVYAAEQYSNTVSVVDPASNVLLGVIRLGDPAPASFSPLYRGQLLVHGMGFSPDRGTIAVVSVGSNSVSFIDTATNRVKHTTYLGRSPHEAFYTPDGRELWVTVRGEDYVSVIDAATFSETARIATPPGPGMQIFSPDGRYAYICSSFTPQTIVVDTSSRQVVGRVAQESPFCPNIAAAPDGDTVWMTLKDVGKIMVFDARPPFGVRKVLETGPVTNHVNFARRLGETLAYVTVGGLNQVKAYRAYDHALVATIDVGELPHGIWPSGDGSRVYVGLENGDALIAIDTVSQKVVARIPIGQAPQAVNYVVNAVPEGAEAAGLETLGVAGHVAHLWLTSTGADGEPPRRSQLTGVSLFDQGLVQVIQAAVTGLLPGRPYTVALSLRPDGAGPLQPLARFTTNPAGAAIVNTVGPIRQLVSTDGHAERRYLVIAPELSTGLGAPVQVQVP